MKILAIRFARFGDIVLLLPALNQLKSQFPESHLTFLTDRRWGPLAEMCPAVDEVLTIDRLEMRDGSRWKAFRAMLRIASDVRRRRFDAVIDFHGFRETNLLAWWSGATQRLGLKRFDQSFLKFCFNMAPVREDKALHVSEMFKRVARSLGGDPKETSLPAMVLTAGDRQWAGDNAPPSPFAALFTDAPVPERAWPEDRFAAVAEHLSKNLGFSVAMISGSPRQNRGGLNDPQGVRAYSGLTIPQLAALIGRAGMLVSNDTGPMHLGPALNVPTVGIFSVGIPAHFRPTGSQDRVVQGNPIDRVEIRDVLEQIDVLLATIR